MFEDTIIDIKTLDIESAQKVVPIWELTYKKGLIKLEKLEQLLKGMKQILSSLEAKKLDIQCSIIRSKHIIKELCVREKQVLQDLQKLKLTYPICKTKYEKIQDQLKEKVFCAGKQHSPQNIDITCSNRVELFQGKEQLETKIQQNEEYIEYFIKKYVN